MNAILMLYGAGSLGGLVSTFIGWALGEAGIIGMLGTGYHPSISSPGIYFRLVWGGIWAWVCLLPGLSRLGRSQNIVLLSLFPSAAQLLYFMPQSGMGWFGTAYGTTTPLVVAALNLLWAAIVVFLGQSKAGKRR